MTDEEILKSKARVQLIFPIEYCISTANTKELEVLGNHGVNDSKDAQEILSMAINNLGGITSNLAMGRSRALEAFLCGNHSASY